MKKRFRIKPGGDWPNLFPRAGGEPYWLWESRRQILNIKDNDKWLEVSNAPKKPTGDGWVQVMWEDYLLWRGNRSEGCCPAALRAFGIIPKDGGKLWVRGTR